MKKTRITSIFLLFYIALSLAACSTKRTGAPAIQPQKDSAPKAYNVDVHSIPDAVPRPEPRSRYGNPNSYVVWGKRYHVLPSSKGYYARGIASWYGTKFHQKRTSSGEPYDMFAMTAAHTSLPLPTYVRVTNLRNNRSVVVKVNDRGPFHDKRLIDLSYAAAKKLDVTTHGTDLVEVVALDPHSTPTPSSRRQEHYVEAPPAAGIFLQVGVFS